MGKAREFHGEAAKEANAAKATGEHTAVCADLFGPSIVGVRGQLGLNPVTFSQDGAGCAQHGVCRRMRSSCFRLPKML